MRQVESYDALTAKTSAFFGRGMVTNCFLTKEVLSQEIAVGNLYFAEAEGALLLLRRRETHWQMYFYLLENAELPQLPGIPFVTELACRPRDTALLLTSKRLQSDGLQLLCKRRRLKRGLSDAVGTAEFAEAGDLDEALLLLQAGFSSLTGCLPTRDELARDIENREVLVARRDKKIAGLLHLQYTKPAFEIRHLVTDAAYRGQGVATELLNALFSLPDARGYRVWVVEGNENAERLYEKNGFIEDGFFSQVLGNLIEKEG